MALEMACAQDGIFGWVAPSGAVVTAISNARGANA
jgi:hypothetical protein